MTGESLYKEDRISKAEDVVTEERETVRFFRENLSHSQLTNTIAKNLSQLKLSGNGLSQLPADLPPLDTITFVDLSRNHLKEVPLGLKKLKNLRVLNLSHNELSRVPDALFDGLYLLKSLDLSNNKLVTFQKVPSCLALLQNLNLSSNKLVAPPPWLLVDFPSFLHTLDLSFNPCFELSPRHSQMKDSLLLHKRVADKVKILRLVSCGLRGSINERYLMFFKNITHLDLSNKSTSRDLMNFITDISKLPESVEELTLRGIGLSFLPKSITTLTNLRKLDISENSINWLPLEVEKLTKLTVMRAESNKLYHLPPEMNRLPNIKELYLSKNEISCSDGFDELGSLEVLDLYENQFMIVPDFKKLLRLRALDFCQNYVDPPELIVLGNEICPYEKLREFFRFNYKRSSDRHNGTKEFPVEPCYEDENDRFSNYSDIHSEEEGDIDVDHQEHYSGEDVPIQEKEVWDLDNDDDYEPREVPTGREVSQALQEAEEQMTGQTPYEVLNHPHFFIPFRTASPSCPPEEFDEPVNGQFDDD